MLIRSCWDYHRKLDAFLSWIAGLEARGVNVVNPPPLIRWNARKRYLLELATGVPTLLLERGDTADLETRLHDLAGVELVAKPEVSASSFKTHRLMPLRSPSDMRILEHLTAERSVIVQPLLDDILMRRALTDLVRRRVQSCGREASGEG